MERVQREKFLFLVCWWQLFQIKFMKCMIAVVSSVCETNKNKGEIASKNCVTSEEKRSLINDLLSLAKKKL